MACILHHLIGSVLVMIEFVLSKASIKPLKLVGRADLALSRVHSAVSRWILHLLHALELPVNILLLIKQSLPALSAIHEIFFDTKHGLTWKIRPPRVVAANIWDISFSVSYLSVVMRNVGGLVHERALVLKRLLNLLTLRHLLISSVAHGSLVRKLHSKVVILIGILIVIVTSVRDEGA